MRSTTLPIVLTLVILMLLGGCASNADREKGVSEQEVYETAQRYLNSNSWQSAIQTLQLLEENFPFGTYGEQAQLELIYAHYQAQNYDELIAVADRFIRLHPQHEDVDYAYYMRGLASFHREQGFLGSLFGEDNTTRDPGAARESFDHFTQFIQKFPDSPYAPDAQKRMIFLRNALARYEIHIANYYFKRGAFLAAAQRGSYVVANFQQTPAVPDALAVMAQAYYLLGREELAEDAVRVLASNFPEYPALSRSGEFDQEYYLRSKKRGWFSILTLGLFERAELDGFDTRALYNPEYQPQPSEVSRP